MARAASGSDGDDCGPADGVGLVLDALSAQVRDTSRHIEESVSRVCTSFASIARRTKENAAHAVRSADRGGGTDGDPLVTARATIAAMLGRMDQVRRAADESVETLRRLEGIATRVDRIQASLEQVDGVAHALRILALNAKIEAARAGDQGNAFGVVASETGVLANTIRQTSRSVHEMVDELWQEMKDSTVRMRAGLIQDRGTADVGRAADLSREEGTRALDALTRAHTDMQGRVAEAATNSERLAGDIEEAMTALQFQDAVSQQLDHVAAALGEARAALDAGDGSRADDLIERLRTRSTMRSERQILDRLSGRTAAGSAGAETPADAADAAPGSVELF
jgi:methyl-accepting chemotaxis protein